MWLPCMKLGKLVSIKFFFNYQIKVTMDPNSPAPMELDQIYQRNPYCNSKRNQQRIYTGNRCPSYNHREESQQI